MQWVDEGIILHTQPLGERKHVVSLFTEAHGRHAGVAYCSKKTTSWIHCGGKVNAQWKARLETQLGAWTLEPLPNRIALLLDQAGPLSALMSAATLCHLALPERHPYPALYQKFMDFLEALTSPGWREAYIFFELSLLEDLGYGLHLEACAVTGSMSDLVAVSPRTGRAVSREIAAPYAEKLLPLPSFLLEERGAAPSPPCEKMLEALRLTGYFLERHLLGRILPPARARLVNTFL